MSKKLAPPKIAKTRKTSGPSYTIEQKLNAFLHIYDVYKDVITHYLDNLRNPSNNDLNIFYMRELVPTIQALEEDLHLNDIMAENGMESPLNYTPFQTLFEIEVVLRGQEKNSDEGRADLYYIFSQIKILVESLEAVGQTTIPEIESVVKEARKLMTISDETEPTLSSRDTPRFLSERGQWYILTGKNQKKSLFEGKTLRGELLGVLDNGVERLKDDVYSLLGEKTGGVIPNFLQITNSVKDINRKLKKNKIPPLRLVSRGRYWQLLFKQNHQ